MNMINNTKGTRELGRRANEGCRIRGEGWRTSNHDRGRGTEHRWRQIRGWRRWKSGRGDE